MLRDNQKNIIYVIVLVIPFLLFAGQSRFFKAVKSGFLTVATIPIKIISFPVREVKKIIYYHRTYEAYKTIRKEVNYLKARLIGIDEIARENARLADLLEMKRSLVYSSVAANVVGREPTYWNNAMIIDKGKEDGIEVGQPVVNALGVVGKVSEVGETTSKVILITDPQFSLAVLVKRTRESGLISGTLDGNCRMNYIAQDALIRPGDQVITSKLSSSFPENLMVGTIVDSVENPRTMSIEAVVEPAVALSQLEEVLVIKN